MDPSSSPSSSSSSPGPGPHSTTNNGLSGTSIGVIVAFHICFVAFLLASMILGPHLSGWVNALPSSSSSSTTTVTMTTTNNLLPRTTTRKKRRAEMHRPKLWEVRLNDDRRYDRELKRSNEAAMMRNLQAKKGSPASPIPIPIPQPVAAWTDDDDDGTTPPFKASTALVTSTVLPGMNHVAAMTQPWCWSSYPFLHEHLIQSSAPRPPGLHTLHVAVLVAMPSPRPEAPTHAHAAWGTTLDKFRRDVAGMPPLSYGDGQLLMGVTSLPCEDRVIRGRTTL
ncbi:hypothetical protein BGW80DRAFT_1457084 [Lactifluus volemus]|nr:hypothetical protein BGW80DRAFT_1457084 [Lactifluus volemus]